jgi:hypothetical protein
MRVATMVLLASGIVIAGSGGTPAVYVVGNLEIVSPGAEGILVLEKEQASSAPARSSYRFLIQTSTAWNWVLK